MSYNHWLVSIGSNIDPELNIPAILNELIDHFDCLAVSRLVFTEPSGIASENIFINALVLLKSKLDAGDIKQVFNAIETRLGRNRLAPNKKFQDRTADIDILCSIDTLHDEQALFVPNEEYLQPIFAEFAEFLGVKCQQLPPLLIPGGVELSVRGALLGKTPATIDRDGNACHIVVAE